MSFVSCFVKEKTSIKGFLCERKAFFLIRSNIVLELKPLKIYTWCRYSLTRFKNVNFLKLERCDNSI